MIPAACAEQGEADAAAPKRRRLPAPFKLSGASSHSNDASLMAVPVVVEAVTLVVEVRVVVETVMVLVKVVEVVSVVLGVVTSQPEKPPLSNASIIASIVEVVAGHLSVLTLKRPPKLHTTSNC